MLSALGIAVVAVLYRRGRPAGSATSADWCFSAGMVALAVALVSPLDHAAAELASAHMIQHVLLLTVAAPLVAYAAPGPSLARGLPTWFRRQTDTIRRGFGIDVARIRRWREPVARVLLFVVALWVWHASVLYEAALGNDAVHVLQHGSFLLAGLLVWSLVLGPRRVALEPPAAVVVVFVLTVQNVFLSALLTFATEPWYDAYVETAPTWGIDALTDQHIAGVLMWVPVGLVHVGVALTLLYSWLHADEPTPATSAVGSPR